MSPSLYLTGRLSEALAVERTLLEMQGDGDDPRLSELPPIVDEQSFKEAVRILADITAERSHATGTLAAAASILYLYAGDHEQAIEWIERALEQREPNLPYLRTPELDPIRDDPRVVAVMETIGI